MSQSATNLMKSFYPTMSAKEKKIADYFLQHQQETTQLSIAEIAQKLQIANSTIFRFAQKLGYAGFQEFKLAFIKDADKNIQGNQLFEEIKATDSLSVLAKKVFAANQKSLDDTSSLLTDEKLQHALDIIQNCQTLAFFGSGGSAAVALDAYHKFLRSPIRCSYSMDHHFQLMQAAQLSKTDAAVIISHSGANKDTLDIAKILKEKQIPIIAITSHAGSPLALMADCCFFSIAEETVYRSEALSSRISQLSLIDTLYVSISVRDPEAAASALEKVRDVIRETRES